ncbi:hypothetical protein OEW28_16475 [Defluviimonas sp. WL0002]|uniref:Helix-turn-helix domain-containing protein n=1 Tax=Albidovulum marisflavi TaxID=2984159 RepID=A0ABT2ZGE9_9RHOB|nr:hypothetical protein [Defluviimonas sp. WL0002]MCV2870223.1 hypothetical protein [Defluviimonas sp. WL0002]
MANRSTQGSSGASTLSKRQGWTGIPNRIFADERLSMEAIGFLGLLLSMAEGWVFRDRDLQQRARLGENRYQRVKAELKASGYLRIERVRGDEGRFGGWSWDVSDTPTETGVSRTSVKPSFGKSGVHKPTKTKEHQKEETPLTPQGECVRDGKSLLSDNEQALKPSDISELFQRLWKEYPRKEGEEPALKVFQRAMKRGADAEAIIAGARRYAETDRVARGVSMGLAKWLNNQRWRDPVPDEDLSPEQRRWKARLAALKERETENWGDPC